jgi:hypothetical protein
MPSDRDKPYEIGYGKPPVRTRFPKGQSGNPKGRPKDSKNSATLFEQALDETVVIKEGGLRKKITKREAMYKQLANRSAEGDRRAIQITLNELHVIDGRADLSNAEPAPFDEAEQEIIEDLIQRLKAGGEDDGGKKSD